MLKRDYFGKGISEKEITDEKTTDPTAPRKRRGVGEEEDAKPKTDATTTDSDVAEEENLAAEKPMATPIKQQTITFVGSGQVTCLLAGLIALQNRKLKAAGLPQIKISILGREGSESLETIKTKGITLIMADGSVEKIEADEFFATDNPDEIKNQDHIFVALKTTAYENEASCDAEIAAINKMKKPEDVLLPGEITTVTLAQNGIPCWFMSSIGKKDIELSTIGFGKKLVDGIGINNIIGCILNLACKVNFTSDGKPNYGTYHVATPKGAIGTPLDHVLDTGEERENLVSLQKILNSSGINTAMKKMDLRYDLLMKLQVNIALNGLSAITGLATSKMMEDPKLVAVMHALSTDISAIADSPPQMNFILRGSEELESRIRVNAAHTTSMGVDFNSGKALEIGSIYGAIVEIAKEMGLRTPKIIKKMVEVLKELVSLRDTEDDEHNKRPIELCRSMITPGLEELKDMVQRTFAPPSPITRPRRVSIHTSSSSSDDGAEFNFTNYESLTYTIKIGKTPTEETHSTLVINAKKDTTSTANYLDAMKSLCKEFIRDQSSDPEFQKTYTNELGKPRRKIKFNSSDGCIAISHEPVYKAFEKWCLTKNLKFSSVHEKTGVERASIKP